MTLRRLASCVCFVAAAAWCATGVAQADAGSEAPPAEAAAPSMDAAAAPDGHRSPADTSVEAGAPGAKADAGADPRDVQVVAAPAPELLPGDRSALPKVLVVGPRDCPDTERLVAETEASEGRLRLRPVNAEPADYVVRFRPWEGGYDAEIRDAAGRVRSLEGDGSGCGELGLAVGLSLLVLVDAAAEAQRTSPPNPEAVPQRHIRAKPIPAEWRARAGGMLGVGGVLAPLPVAGVYARFTGTLEISSWLLYGFGQSVTHGPGQVELGWLGLGAELCYPLFDFAFCGGGWAGQLSAQGTGYDRNTSVNRWQPGLSFGARFRRQLGARWEWGVAGMGLVPLTEERITVAGVEGDAFTTSRLNPLVFLELGARF